MAEMGQMARRDSRSEDAGRVAFDPFDPVALEARLAEARARREVALAKRKGKGGKDEKHPTEPKTPAFPLRAGAASALEPAAPPRVEIIRASDRLALRREPGAGSSTASDRVTKPAPAPAAAAVVSGAPRPLARRLLPAAVFLASPLLVGAAIVLAPPSLRQDIAEWIAPAPQELALTLPEPVAAPAGPSEEAPQADAASAPEVELLTAAPVTELVLPQPLLPQDVARAPDAPTLPALPSPVMLPTATSFAGRPVAPAAPDAVSAGSAPSVSATEPRLPTILADAPAPLAVERAGRPNRPDVGPAAPAVVPERPATLADPAEAPAAARVMAVLPRALPAPPAIAVIPAPVEEPSPVEEPPAPVVEQAALSPPADEAPDTSPADGDAAQNDAPAPAPPAPQPAPPAGGGPAAEARVVVHYPSSASQEAGRVVEALESSGVDQTSLVAAAFSISQPNVRFYHAGDESAARSVAQILEQSIGTSVAVRDFTSFRPSPAPSMVEVWLSGEDAGAPVATQTPRPPPTQAAPPVAAAPRPPPPAAAQRAAQQRDALRERVEREVERLLVEQLLQLQRR
jgi:hypothetical protein